VSFDLICVGGGIAGSSLARAMAAAGAKVLVLERERKFRDRVRGEQLQPWGVAEAKRLGLYELILKAGGVEALWWSTHRVGERSRQRRALSASGPHRLPGVNVQHPVLQEAVLGAAEAAGATVLRGAMVTGMTQGARASVSYRLGGVEQRRTGRLVVAADGRASRARVWAGGRVSLGASRLRLGGVLLTGLVVEPSVVNVHYDFAGGLMVMVAEVGGGRQRVYLGFHAGRRIGAAPGRGSLVRGSLGRGSPAHGPPAPGEPMGPARARRAAERLSLEAFTRLAQTAGATDYGLESATPAGPLAVFDGRESWVDTAAGDGLVLIGDAAAVSDPNFGCGLALTLRDVRVLVDELLVAEDPRAGARAYAASQRDYAAALRRLVDWLTTVYREPGEAADRLRDRLLPLLEREPWRIPDLVAAGPDAASDRQARALLLAEDIHGPDWHGLGPWRP